MPLSSVLGAQSLVKPGVCTSTSRPASPFEGQTIYETDTDQLLTYNGSGWKPFADVTASTNGAVLQVVSTAKTDTFATSSTTFTDITGLSVSITPSATSSKILVIADLKVGSSSVAMSQLLRGATPIYVGDAAGSRSLGINSIDATDYYVTTHSAVFLDSPNTTSSTTYKLQGKSQTGATVYWVNRTRQDTDTAALGIRTASSITVMEISG